MNTPNWVPHFFEQSFCSGEFYFLDNITEPKVTIKGKISKNITLDKNPRITYWAANPAQRGISPMLVDIHMLTQNKHSIDHQISEKYQLLTGNLK